VCATHQPLHHCYDLSITKKHTDCCNTPTITPLLRSVHYKETTDRNRGVMVGVLQQSMCFFVINRSQQWCNGWCVTTICVFLCNGQIVAVVYQPLHHCCDLSITKKHTACCNTPIITPLLRSIHYKETHRML
jgi:hypothetical protein